MSIGFLAAIKAGVSTLTGRLTSGRATALDNLDATVSSRAASATALSSATWTGARAGYLDKIGVKSIQSGYVEVTCPATATGTNTATLGTSVGTGAAFVINRGMYKNGFGNTESYLSMVELTNGTTVTAALTRDNSSGTAVHRIHYTVIEFNG